MVSFNGELAKTMMENFKLTNFMAMDDMNGRIIDHMKELGKMG